MSDIKFPSIINITFDPPKAPGEKVRLHLNQPMHLVAAMSRRGSYKLCFKLPAAYCNELFPEGYNNSMLDVNLATAEYKIYPKARMRDDVLTAVAEIVNVFIAGGLVEWLGE
jgi:hypothetical protein